MSWIIFALLSAFFFGTYNVFIKLSSGHIHQIVGAVTLQVVAALLGVLLLIIMKLSNTPMEVSNKGIWFAVLAGIAVGLSEIFSFYMFSKGVNASIGIPIVIGGAIFIGTLLSLVVLKENFQPIHYLAAIMVIAGVVILSMK